MTRLEHCLGKVSKLIDKADADLLRKQAAAYEAEGMKPVKAATAAARLALDAVNKDYASTLKATRKISPKTVPLLEAYWKGEPLSVSELPKAHVKLAQQLMEAGVNSEAELSKVLKGESAVWVKPFAEWMLKNKVEPPTAPDKPKPAPTPEVKAEPVAKKPAPKLPPKIQKSPKTTSVKNAETDKELEDAGFAPVYAPARVALQESLDKALKEVNDDPNKGKENSVGKNLVEELHQKQRPVSDVEHGILIDELAKAKVRASRAEKSMFEAAKLDDPVKLATAQNELSAARNEIARVAMASKLTGTELGRSFRFRQIRLEEDYSIEAMASRFQADINDGKPLNDKQEKMIRKLQEELEASEKVRIAAEESLAAEVATKEQLQQENLQLKEQLAAAKKPRKAPERKSTSESQAQRGQSAREKLMTFSVTFKTTGKGPSTLDRMADNARQRIKARSSRTSAGVDPVVLLDVTIIAAQYIKNGITKLADVTAQLVKDFGEDYRKYAEPAFNKANESVNSTVDEDSILELLTDVAADYSLNGLSNGQIKEKILEEFGDTFKSLLDGVIEGIKPRITKTAAGSRKKSPQELASLIDPSEKLSRQMIYNMAGGLLPKFRGDALINEILRLIQPSLPHITFNDVVDAYTGYGKAKFPSKEELATLQRKERRLQLLNRQIGVVLQGQLPELTGLQQDRLDPNNEDDQKIRSMIAERNQLMKDLKIPGDSAKRNQMREALSAIKTRYRNDLAELEKAIKTRIALVEKKKQNPQTDKELTELKAQKKAKRAEYNEAFGIKTRQLSLEQRLKAADKALDKSLALEEKMELEGTLKRPTKPGLPQTVEMKAKAAQIKAKRDARHAETRRLAREAKELLNPPKTDAEKWNESQAKALEKTIERFEYYKKHGKYPDKTPGVAYTREQLVEDLLKIKNDLKDHVTKLQREKRLTPRDILAARRRKKLIDKLNEIQSILDKQVESGIYITPAEKTKQSDAEIIAINKVSKSLRESIILLKKADPNWVASYEAKLNEALIKASESRTAKWEQRLRDKDFSVAVKPSRVKTRELIDTMHREVGAKQAWNKLFFDSNMDKRTKLERAQDIILAPVDAIRTIKTIGDVSAPHRQGLLSSVAHPRLALRNYMKMWKAGRSSKNLTDITHEIENNKYYVASQRGKTKLFLAKTGPGATLADLEEAFRGRLVDHIPLASQVKGFSERTYNGFLNGMRMDHFSVIADSISGGDPNNLTNEQISEIANYVNISTGRGNLGQHETAAGLLALAFFSPKFLTSRFQWLTGALLALPDVTLDAVFKIRTPEMRKVRQAIALEQARSIVGLAALYSLYVFGQMMYGDDDEDELKEILSFNPLSSKGGRIKMGDTYVDPAGGLAQTVNFLARTIVNKTVTGNGEERDLGDAKFGQQDFGGLLWQFTRTKLAPVPGSIINVRSGRNVVGQKATLRSEAIGSVVPMIINDSYETLRANGMAQGVPLAVLAAHGVGLSTRDNKPSLAQQAAILTGDDPALFEKSASKKSTSRAKIKIKPLSKQK